VRLQQEQSKKQTEVSNELICNVEKFYGRCNLVGRFFTSKAGCIMIVLAADVAKSEEV
jgi:hypothetical protein